MYILTRLSNLRTCICFILLRKKRKEKKLAYNNRQSTQLSPSIFFMFTEGYGTTINNEDKKEF